LEPDQLILLPPVMTEFPGPRQPPRYFPNVTTLLGMDLGWLRLVEIRRLSQLSREVKTAFLGNLWPNPCSLQKFTLFNGPAFLGWLTVREQIQQPFQINQTLPLGRQLPLQIYVSLIVPTL
jgi:hypothetical protein